jgi:hypothetical protein
MVMVTTLAAGVRAGTFPIAATRRVPGSCIGIVMVATPEASVVPEPTTVAPWCTYIMRPGRGLELELRVAVILVGEDKVAVSFVGSGVDRQAFTWAE